MKPVVLVHGYLGFDNLESVTYFNGVADHLHQKFGLQVFTSKTGPKDSVRQRSADLEREIQENCGQPAHLIAHSMGGLDARYLLVPKAGGSSKSIASLTTICTPHAGTYLADIAIQARNPAALAADARFQQVLEGAFAAQTELWTDFGSALLANSLFETLGFRAKEVVDTVRSVLSGAKAGDPAPLAAYIRKLFGLTDNALPDLTTAGCSALFGSGPLPVPCFNFAASGRPFHTMSPLFLLSYLLLRASDGDNDGMVPVRSAQAFGTSKGVFSTDHAGVIGWGPGFSVEWYDEIVRNLENNVPDP